MLPLITAVLLLYSKNQFNPILKLLTKKQKILKTASTAFSAKSYLSKLGSNTISIRFFISPVITTNLNILLEGYQDHAFTTYLHCSDPKQLIK